MCIRDRYQDDIRETFESSYVGKVINDYDNKQAFVAAILAYHLSLIHISWCRGYW